MKNEKEEIDRLIEQALTEEEAAFYHSLDEQSLIEMVGGLFKGKLAFITILTVIIGLLAFIVAVYFAYKFFTADDIRLMIQYGFGSFCFLMMMSMLKLFHWMQLDKNAITREIKRMELQISVLAGRLKDKN